MNRWIRLSRESMTSGAVRLSTVAGCVALLMSSALAQDSRPLPKNMGAGLKELVQMHYDAVANGKASVDLRAQHGKTARPSTSSVFRINVDAKNRVLIEVHLDGTVSPAVMRERLQAAGASVTALNESYRGGVIAAHVPLSAAEELARTAGVRSMMLVHRPFTDAGKITSQGTRVIRSNLVNGTGVTGKGVTVGVISDSYNTSGNPINAEIT